MIGPRLQIRQSQQLVMTPQLRQAIQLLQLNNLELDRFLESELERNPLLQRAESGSEAPAPAPRPAERLEIALSASDPGAAAGRLDGGAENLWDAEPTRRIGGSGGGEGEAPPPFDAAVAARPGRLELLCGQIRLMAAPPDVRAVALHLAAEVDGNGWLRADAGETAARLRVPPETVEAATALLQRCEPAGVGARTLAECLALQLAARGRLDPAMKALLDHLPLLARGDLRALARRCGVEPDGIRDMAAELRGLDPRPGLGLGEGPAPAAPPDVLVRAAPGGGWDVTLNEATLPRLLVDRRYAARVSGAGDAAARAFVSDCAQSAAFLLRSLDQRARTILAVAGEVVRRQDAFLREGVAALRPMTLRMVAEEIGVHESTVSRVAAGKRLACPRGAFDLRWFFSQGLASADGGEAHSAVAVRARIRALIEAEDARATLSDDALAERLKTEGVDVARRTVAKYREAMSIPSSTRRRRLKAGATAG